MKTTSLRSFKATTDWLDDLTALCPDHQFAFDAHARPFGPWKAVHLGNALAPHDPPFFEEPIRPENAEAWGSLKARLRVPLATGETLFGKFEVLYPYMQKDGYLELRPGRPSWGVKIDKSYLKTDRYVHWDRRLPMRPDGPTACT